MTPFTDTKDGQTHYFGDGCKEHTETTPPRLMFAIVTEDIAGPCIQLFKTKKQASEFFDAIK